MAVEIRLLGPFQAIVDGESVDVGRPQQRTLLALLALQPGTLVRTNAIEAAIWPDEAPASAGKVVQTSVSRLRKLLGPDAIEWSHGGYTLAGSVDVDVQRFRELVAARRPAEALALWRGPALVDVPALEADAQRLDDLRLSALESRIDADLDAGLGPELVPELEALVAEQPTRERLLGQLVLSLYRSGRQSDALDAYRRGRRALDELGLEPSPSLRALEVRILRHDPTLLPMRERSEPRRRRGRVIAMAAVAAALAAIAATTLATSGHAQKDVTIRPNILLEIDPQTNHLVSSVPVGRDEAGLAATGDALWLASERDRTVSRVDLGTRTVKTIGEAEPVAFLTHDDRGNIYASGWDFPFVWQIDPRSVQIVRRFAVKTRALGLTVGGGSLWVVDRLANAVTRIDLAQQRVAQTISVGADPLAAAFGYGSLWVANSDSGTVSVIRPGATRPLVVDDIPRPFGISAGGGGIWVASNVGYVYRIDPDTHAVVARVNLGILSDYVYGIAAGPHGVWAISDHHLIRIDPRTNRIAARFRFPRDTEPKAVAFTPSSIWVSVGNPKDDM